MTGVLGPPDASTILVVVEGEIGFTSAPRLRAVFAPALTSAEPEVVVDASRVFSIDASGLALILLIAEQLHRQGRRLSLRAPSAALRSLLALTGPHESLGEQAAQQRSA
jgi:anti-anti-sigma factor